MDLMVLNEKFESVAILDDYESMIWTDRYSSYGDFELYTTASKVLIDTIKQNYYIWCAESEHVMIVDNVKIESDVELGAHITFSGYSLESLLERRIIWNQTLLNGKLQTAIKKLITENVISPSISYRKIPNFIFEDSTDPTITSLTVDTQFTGTNLYEAIQTLCDAENIGFKVTLNEENQFVFKLYSGVDRSYEQDANPYVVFSPSFENIINSNYLNSLQTLKNVTLVAGEGEGTERRTLAVGQTTVSGLERRELFTDARDISSTTIDTTLTTAQYNALLKTRGEEKLANTKRTQAYEGQVEATRMFKYGTDFFMGDICQLENEYDMESRVRVIEFIRSENRSGIEYYPTFEIVDEEEGG